MEQAQDLEYVGRCQGCDRRFLYQALGIYTPESAVFGRCHMGALTAFLVTVSMHPLAQSMIRGVGNLLG